MKQIRPGWPFFMFVHLFDVHCGDLNAAASSKAGRGKASQRPPRPPEPEGEKGTEFLLIEQWESIDQRMAFTLNRKKERDKELFPYLLPQHAAEYYDEVTG